MGATVTLGTALAYHFWDGGPQQTCIVGSGTYALGQNEQLADNYYQQEFTEGAGYSTICEPGAANGSFYVTPSGAHDGRKRKVRAEISYAINGGGNGTVWDYSSGQIGCEP
jgi:hypothetical protein